MYPEQSPYRGKLLARSSTVNFSLWYGRFSKLSMILPMVLLMYLTIYDCCHICFSQELNFPHQLPPINLATNRQLQQNPKLQPRVLVVQLAKDQSATYNSVMNSIFRYKLLTSAAVNLYVILTNLKSLCPDRSCIFD